MPLSLSILLLFKRNIRFPAQFPAPSSELTDSSSKGTYLDVFQPKTERTLPWIIPVTSDGTPARSIAAIITARISTTENTTTVWTATSGYVLRCFDRFRSSQRKLTSPHLGLLSCLDSYCCCCYCYSRGCCSTIGR